MSRCNYGRQNNKWQELFLVQEFGIIDGGKVFLNIGNVFQIGRSMFYDRKNKIRIKIPAKKRSGIEIIAEFCGIPSGFPNQ
jgi:hypothetical protein